MLNAALDIISKFGGDLFIDVNKVMMNMAFAPIIVCVLANSLGLEW